VFIEPIPDTYVLREEQGKTLVNQKYMTEGFNTLLHYLAAEKRIILPDPAEPKKKLDDDLFPTLPVLFKDSWRTQCPDAGLRVELLKLQATNPEARFQDLLSLEDQRLICEVVWSELARRKVNLLDLYHASGVPTPCGEFPLELFARRGLSTAELCRDKREFEIIRSGPHKNSKRTPEHIEVAYAWRPNDMLPREILRGSKGSCVTLKGYAFCQLIRHALLMDYEAGGNLRSYDREIREFQVNWFGYRIQQYFQTPQIRTLRWYSWIAQPLFYLLEQGDDWAWGRFAALAKFLGWRKEYADLFRNMVSPPSNNEKYQSLKREILREHGAALRSDLSEWFNRLETQFIGGIGAFWMQALRVHWLMKDTQFVIPYLLLRIYRKRDLNRYRRYVLNYLNNLKILFLGAPIRREHFQYEVWEFETLSKYDPWYSICLNWEIWVGSEDMLRAVFTPPKHKGFPLKFEVKRIISECLPLFSELSNLRVRSRIRRGMALCNALCGENIYPENSERIFDRDVRRSRSHK